VNGHLGDPQNSGSFTFVNQNGCSTIDFVIVTRPIFKDVSDFTLLHNTESIHTPLLLQTKIHAEKRSQNKPKQKTFYNIDCDNADAYKQCLTDSILQGSFDRVEEMINNNIKAAEIIQEFDNCITDCSEAFKKCNRSVNYTTHAFKCFPSCHLLSCVNCR